MSSPAVRTAILAEIITLAAPWDVFDASEYDSLEEILSEISESAVVVQFVASTETMQSIGGAGNQCWEEAGSVVVHLFIPTGFNSSVATAKGETIRLGLRGRRITADITVESMDPFADFFGGSIGVDGPVHGFASNLFYERRTHG